MAQSVADAEAVVAAARSADRVLMVGHLLEYHPGVVKLKELIDGGDLGRALYVYGNRLNLGKLRSDENALWSLGAHDISVLLRLAGEEPTEIQARGESYTREGVEDVVFCFLRFPSGLAAHLHLSWLDPHKERRFTVVGEQRMATFDDMALEGKITVYDKGFDEREGRGSYGEYITRSGDIWSPRLPNLEPLRTECEHFVQSIRSGTSPISDGEAGLRVVRVLEALQHSLDETRRKYWESQGDPPRPAHPPAGDVVDQNDGPWGEREHGYTLAAEKTSYGALTDPAEGYTAEHWAEMTMDAQKLTVGGGLYCVRVARERERSRSL